MLTLTPSKTKEALIKCFKAKLVPFLQSSPGMGKSSLIKEIAKEWNLELIDVRLSTMEPCDLNGLPTFDMDGKATFHPYSMYPLEGMTPPEGKDGWLLFLDEFNAAPRAVQAAAYRVVLDHEIGQYKLHPNCLVACAGNLSTDNAITTRLSTAMLSRLIHIHMEVSLKDWMEAVAIPQAYDERVIAFLNMYPDKLMQFDPEREDETFSCPRTWEFTNRLIKPIKNLTETDAILLSGTITPDIATEFVQFTKVYKHLVTLKEIVDKDGDCPVPDDMATRYAILVHLMMNVKKDDFEPVLKYVDKFDSSMKIVFVRNIIKRMPEFRTHPAMVQMIIREGKYLLG